MIEPGKLLQQRYRIDKQIGQGGMGAVYIATDERFGSTVAIKETLLMDDNYRKAIEREARLLNSLKHAALPRVSDHFLEENGQFLVMEYIPGEDLAHMIESGTIFDVDRVLKWADQLLDALDFLHNQSMPVIHRDIKPQNLKITARDQIILLDFGLAKGNPTDAGHQTAAKSIFGYSRNYASVEQIQGTGTDPRSDLYSLAATLYHLLTGTPPEDALTRAMAVLSSRPDPLVPANAARKEVPAGIAGVLQTALALNADDRPTSAAEMREMLREPQRFASRLTAAPTMVSATAADLSAQPTKLMGSDTRHELTGHTDVKTAVHPGYVSTETTVRPAAGTGGVGNRAGRRRFALTAAALAAVLIACSGAVGLYFLDPSMFGNKSVVPAVAEPEARQAPLPTATAPANASTDIDPEMAGGQPGESEQSASSKQTSVPPKADR
ncbi:MAG TPA: serine/threonine-protein kinase, partial [Pyrinomonadaceae bacterium]